MINENISTDEISMREIWPLLFTRKEKIKKTRTMLRFSALRRHFHRKHIIQDKLLTHDRKEINFVIRVCALIYLCVFGISHRQSERPRRFLDMIARRLSVS